MRLVKKLFKILAVLVPALVALAALLLWWTHPKRPIRGVFARQAGAGVFKFGDVPKGRALASGEIDDYAQRLLGEMTLQRRCCRCPATPRSGTCEDRHVERGKYNDYPIAAGC